MMILVHVIKGPLAKHHLCVCLTVCVCVCARARVRLLVFVVCACVCECMCVNIIYSYERMLNLLKKDNLYEIMYFDKITHVPCVWLDGAPWALPVDC